MKSDVTTTPIIRQIKKMNQLYGRLPEPIPLKIYDRESTKKKYEIGESDQILIY